MTRPDFNDLVKVLSRKLYGYAYRILSSQEEAEDAVQEVFIRLWNMREKLSEYNSPEALAITMTKNYCIDKIRKRKRNRQEELKNRDYINHEESTPLEKLENREAHEIIHRITGQLPEAVRQVVQLREIDGLPYEEISLQTGQNVNALRVAVSRARKYIRDEYNKYQYERKGVNPLTRKVL